MLPTGALLVLLIFVLLRLRILSTPTPTSMAKTSKPSLTHSAASAAIFQIFWPSFQPHLALTTAAMRSWAARCQLLSAGSAPAFVKSVGTLDGLFPPQGWLFTLFYRPVTYTIHEFQLAPTHDTVLKLLPIPPDSRALGMENT